MYVLLESPIAFPLELEGSLLRGLGDQQTAGAIVSGSGAALGAAAAVGVPALLSAGIITAAAVPFIGPAIAAVTLAVGLIVKNSGCGVTCVQTSAWANQAEPLLVRNIQEYFAQPAPRIRSTQKVALANFDLVWQGLQERCGQPGTGNAGVRCISDRQAGACIWKQRADSPLLKFPGEPQPGECWNWFSGYRDPIANDPDVIEDSALLTNAAGDLVDSAGNVVKQVATGAGSSSILLLAGAAALVALGVALS